MDRLRAIMPWILAGLAPMPVGLAAWAGWGPWGLVLAAGSGSLLGLLAVSLRHRAVTATDAPARGGSVHASESSDPGGREALLERIFDRIDVPILVLDGDGYVVRANASLGGMLGRRSQTLVGLSIDELFSQSGPRRCFEEALTGRSATLRIALRVAGVQHSFDASGVLLPEGEGGLVVMTLVDVTELAHSMRLKTDFVANASHELRTPLSAIRGACETLREVVEGDEMQARLVEIVWRHARRLEELVSDLLELSRLEVGRVDGDAEQIDLGAMLDELAQAFAPICERRRLRIETHIDEDCARIVSHRRLLELAVSNYVDNATRFSREGQTVIIRARRVVSNEAGVPDRLRIEVEDRGIGIPLSDQARIFERFYQVDPARSPGVDRGTGLGLAIVKHAAQLLGGQVGVESVLDRGSTFWLEVPVQEPPAQSSGAVSTP